MKILLLLALLSSVGYSQNQPVLKTDGSASHEVQSPEKEPIVEKTYAITISVKNIRNHKGVIRFKFYNDSTGFPHDTGFLKEVITKDAMAGDSIRITYYGFKSQHMAIALLDDENNNVKLDFGWFFPKEGHAFSDYYHVSLRRPVYDDFSFTLTGDRHVVMKMRYY